MYETGKENGDQLTVVFSLLHRVVATAKLAGRKDIADLFLEFNSANEELSNEQTTQKLNELRTKYDIDKLEMQKERHRNNFLFALGGAALLLIIAVLIFINRQKIRRKNILLVAQIKELQELQQIKEDELLQKSTFKTELQTDTALCPDTRKDKLCLALRDMLLKDRLYRDPNITRDSMIALLGTNKTLFIESCQYCFGTLRTFQRQFTAEYGMAISEFRKLAK
jgi:hypothetical protein